MPALSLLPGDSLAQLAMCASVGKRLISRPISARICSAARWPTPGMVSRSLIAASQESELSPAFVAEAVAGILVSRAADCGGSGGSVGWLVKAFGDLGVEKRNLLIQEVQLREMAGNQKAVVFAYASS